MRQRNVKNQDEILSNCSFYTDDLASKKNSLKSKYTKISLEIGIGKGQFIYNLAKQNKDVLYIGIELNKGVVYDLNNVFHITPSLILFYIQYNILLAFFRQ
jgi:tRNA (guanine-N7-)-methyltransferase